MQEKQGKRNVLQITVAIDAKDERLQEIMSRVKGVSLRVGFIKEAIYYWDYVLHRSTEFRSRFISLNTDLKPDEDEFIYIKANQVSLFKPDTTKDRKKISIRVTIGADDKELHEILERATMRSDFIREAIDNWDYILHNTSLHSRYLKLQDNNKKKYYNFGTKSSELNSMAVDVPQRVVESKLVP